MLRRLVECFTHAVRLRGCGIVDGDEGDGSWKDGGDWKRGLGLRGWMLNWLKWLWV